MSQQDALGSETGGEEDADSGVIGADSRVITMDLYNILQNPRSPEWDAGMAELPDGQPFQLWSAVSPEPTILEGETQEVFTERLYTARKARAHILANRARRHEGLVRSGAGNFAAPPAPPLPQNASEAEDEERKQALL